MEENSVGLPEEKKKWARVIDIGDGAGVQKFEADTQEELIEKLALAQENATRKIRKQERELKLGRDLGEAEKETRRTSATVNPLSDEERLRISQDIFDPSAAPKAVRRLVEAELGVPLDEVKTAIQESRANVEAQRQRLAVEEFIAETPEYKPCPQNQRPMTDYLAKHGLAVTSKNLGIAFEDLRESGLLALNEEQEQPRKESPDEGPRIVRRARGETATGIRQEQAGTPVAKRTNGPTPEDLARMSADEYEQRILLPQWRSARAR